MQACKPSPFLDSAKPYLKEAISILKNHYDYVSVLGTDSYGLKFNVTPGERSAGDSTWAERGFVFRIQKDGFIAERAFNCLPTSDTQKAPDGKVIAEAIIAIMDKALLALPKDSRKYPAIPDEQATKTWFSSFKEDPFNCQAEEILNKLAKARDIVQAASKEFVFSSCRAEFMQVSKIFISPNRDLEQSFIWSQAYLSALGRRANETKDNYQSFSGLKGLEILDEVIEKAPSFAKETIELLGAEQIKPGEYDVIMNPDVAGILAHEAFGHGVEADMFVKGRAKGIDYIGKPVASKMVTMFDGAEGILQTGTFLFDDEGTFGTKTAIVTDGILTSALSDIQSALALGFKATGNGRRQAYDHKAYARMTNTYFKTGDSTLEEMISSIKYGYLLEKANSGMEDPKNWGIQLILLIGREIKDGKLTGKMVSPIVCSGYVPQVLSDITMLSTSSDFALSGSGYCGKGYKEYVKVSCGGPYLKTKMRLG